MPFSRERLKTRRLDMGITLQEVADSIGVEKATVQRYESGKISKIDTLTVEKLSDAIRCNPAYLMGWQEEPQVSKNDFICSDEERSLILKFRQLNQDGQDYILKQLNFALSQDEYKKCNLPSTKELDA